MSARIKSTTDVTPAQILEKAKLQKSIDQSLKPEDIQKKIDSEINVQLPRLVEEEVKQSLKDLRQEIGREAKKIASESFDDLREKIEKDRLNTIQATSIVTIFIGFLVVQFNILQGDKPVNELMGLSLVLLASIIIFTLLLDLVIKLDLPYKKTRIVKGLLGGGIAQLAQAMSGDRKEEVPLSWKPETWGEGLVIRAVALCTALLIGAIGVLLIAL